jgi:hypothetical protein
MRKSFYRIASVLSAIVAVSAAAQAAPHGIYRIKQDRQLFQALGLTGNKAAEKKLYYYGGPVISHAKVYAVMWGAEVDATTQKQIRGFLENVVNSTYMDWLTEYATSIKAVDGRAGTNQGIGRGSFAGQVVIHPAHTSTNLDDKDIQAELDAQIDAGNLPKPDGDTLYMTYFPPGVSITIEGQGSCSSFCAYHEGFVSKKFGNVFYGVMPDLGGMCSFGCGFQASSFDSLTDVSSHELIEAVTDPFPTPADKPAYPQAWNTTDGNEIGDLCASTSTQLSTQGLTYVVQKEFDNSILGCAAGPYHSP